MAIDVRWADETKTICILDRGEGWTWQEFDDSSIRADTLIKEVKHPVDMIVIGSDQLPTGSPIPHFRRSIQSKPTNVRFLIIIISSAFGRTIFNVVNQLSLARSTRGGPSLRSVSSVEEAFALANKVTVSK